MIRIRALTQNTSMDRDQKLIAIYLPSLNGGGAERVMVTLANGFAERGHRVDLVLATATGPYLTEVSAAVRVVGLRSRGILASLPGLVAYLRRERPDAMLSAMTHANVIAILARMLVGFPRKLVISERSSIKATRSSENMIMNVVIRILRRLLYRKSDIIVAVSRDMAKELVEIFPRFEDKIHYVYNPVVGSQLDTLAARKPDHPWFDDEDVPIVLGVGRLTEQKDFVTLIKAFSRVRTQRRVRLLILGEGEDRQKLEQIAGELGVAEDVSMLGFVENPFCYMRRANLFVLSSRWEGLPGVLIQAMACGARVVSTDCPTGPAEILENGRWGALVPVGDDATLARAMLAALDLVTPPDVRSRANDFRSDPAIATYARLLLGDAA